MNRISLGIAGESGSGLLSMGKIICAALNNRGFFLNADREYPSLIKGGQSYFCINFSTESIHALEEKTDILVSLDKKSAEKYFDRLKPSGFWVHGYERLEGIKHLYKQAKTKNIQIVHLPIREVANECGGTSLMKNVVLLGMVWKVLGLDPENLKAEVTKKFGKKPKLLPINLKCVEAGYAQVKIPENSLQKWSSNHLNQKNSGKNIILDGNHAVALGAVEAGVKFYAAYPMSPSSSILSHMADMASEKKILVKQAEDEITVANLVLGGIFFRKKIDVRNQRRRI